MMDIKEQAIKDYFQVVSEYSKRIVDFLNSSYEANISDVPSLLHFQSMNGIWKFTIEDTEFLFHGIGCSVYKASEEICGWDFSGNGYWCVVLDIFKVATTLKHISGYEEVDTNDIRNLCDRLEQNGIIEKTGKTTYRIKNDFESDFCCKTDI